MYHLSNRDWIKNTDFCKWSITIVSTTLHSNEVQFFQSHVKKWVGKSPFSRNIDTLSEHYKHFLKQFYNGKKKSFLPTDADWKQSKSG